MEELLDNVYGSILDGDAPGTKENVQVAITSGVAAETILNEGMIPAMTQIGTLFEEGEAFVPEMLISARAMQFGLEILRPLLVEAAVEPVGRVVIGTVRGDMHDIGKNLVGMMLEGAGYEIHDLGVDVSADAFVTAVEEIGDVDIVGLSALLTTTMPEMRTVVDAFKRAETYGEVKIMVGGAPLTDEFAASIGAHGCAKDASQAVTLAKSLTGNFG